jgi:hypothetical protein
MADAVQRAWAAALLVAVVAPIRGASYNYYWLQHLAWRPHGLLMARGDQAIIVRGVFGEEARRAGVRPGDRVIAIDGWPVVNGLDDARLYKLLGGEGTSAALTLRSPGGRDREVTLTSRQSTAAELFRGTGATRTMFDAAVHFSDLTFLFFLVPSAVLLFVRRRREIVPALLSMALLIIAGFLTGGQVGLADAGVPFRVTDLIGGGRPRHPHRAAARAARSRCREAAQCAGNTHRQGRVGDWRRPNCSVCVKPVRQRDCQPPMFSRS